jgi:hypothetical protein
MVLIGTVMPVLGHVAHLFMARGEAQQRPVRASALDIDMQLARGRVRMEAACPEGAQLEGPADDEPSRLQERRMDVEVVELAAPVHEVAPPPA